MTTVCYPSDPASVSKARAFVADALSQVSEDVRDRAVLITSELATNAITHAASDFSVTAALRSGRIELAVTDTGGGTPQVRDAGPMDPHGRGLLILSSLADRWGVDAQAASTTVWCMLDLIG